MIEEKLERIATALETLTELVKPLAMGIATPSPEEKVAPKKRTRKSKTEEAEVAEETVDPSAIEPLPEPLPEVTEAQVTPVSTDLPPGIEEVTESSNDGFGEDAPAPAAEFTPSDLRDYAQKVVQALAADKTGAQQKFVTFIQNDLCAKYCTGNERKLIKVDPKTAGGAKSYINMWLKQNVSDKALLKGILG